MTSPCPRHRGHEPRPGTPRSPLRHAADEYAPAPLTVLACFTGWRGNGTLTRAALDRALRCEPDYRLALLLERVVDLAIRPRPNR